MINTGPQSLVLNTPTVVTNPLAEWGNAPTQVQVCNLSGFLIQASAGGLIYMIQSYTALTLPLGQPGANLTMVPFSGAAAAPYNQVTETWLLSDETSPMPDGPLTAAAIAAALGSIPESIATLVDATNAAPQLWIAGIAGKNIYVYNLTVSVATVAGPDIYGDIQQQAVGGFIAFFSLAALQTYTIPLGGYQLPAGQGLYWYIPSGSEKVALTLTYSQY